MTRSSIPCHTRTRSVAGIIAVGPVPSTSSIYVLYTEMGRIAGVGLFAAVTTMIVAVVLELSRPSVLLVGNVTIDLVEGTTRTARGLNLSHYLACCLPYTTKHVCSPITIHLPMYVITPFLGMHEPRPPLTIQGGAVSYAAAVISALGLRACVVTGTPM